MAAIPGNDAGLDHSIIQNRAPHVARLFLDRVQATPDGEAFRFLRDGRWDSLSWSQTGAAVEGLAAGLVALGVRAGQPVALASNTRLEWILAHLAVLLAGAATTTVYPTTSPDEVAYILADSGSVLVFAEDDGQLAILRARRAQLPDVQTVISFAGQSDGDWVIGLDEVRELGAELLRQHPHAVMDRVAGIREQHLATLIYTSGTTGRPKGVRLRHSSLTYEAAAVATVGDLSATDLQLLWLPLSHVFGNILLMVALQVGFATVVDGRVEAIADNLLTARPTVMSAVPRVLDKVHARVHDTVRASGRPRAALFEWGIGVGGQVAGCRRRSVPVPFVLALRFALADRLVLSRVRDRFGGRLRFLISGSAPLNLEIAEWFEAVGIRVLEGYGLTETSAASCFNRLARGELGTVGPPIPGTEVRIADDGEVLLRGPGVMEGYHRMAAVTAETITDDGWLHTGDIGSLDECGYLRITDRKKDLFKTSGGKYVAPSAIESALRAICPYVSQVVVCGDGQSHVTALITLDAQAIGVWAAGPGTTGLDYRELVGSAASRALVQGYVDELNSRLNPWEAIRAFTILDRDLTIADSELTPSLKVRRALVIERFQATVEAMYR
ncbi:MAG: AMP-dependent synthetase/ligase [Jatrophihabitans sp.]